MAGIPDEGDSISKPNQAWAMRKRAVEHQVPLAWVTGDSLNVSTKASWPIGPYRVRVSELLEQLPAEGWTRVRAGPGAKGPRW